MQRIPGTEKDYFRTVRKSAYSLEYIYFTSKSRKIAKSS